MANLTNQMQKIVNYTSKIIGAINYKSVGCNIPVNSYLTVLGVDDELSFNSLSESIHSIQQIKGAIAQGANMVKCAWAIAKNPTQFLDQMINGVAGAMGSVIDQIWNAISYQIYGAVNQVVTTFLNVVNAFQSLITSVLLLGDAIKNFFIGLAEFAEMTFKLQLEQKECIDFYASIAACLLNKYLGPYLDEFTQKVTNKIHEYGNDFNALLYDELQDTNILASYAKQQAFLLKKASLQINGLTPKNLLG